MKLPHPELCRRCEKKTRIRVVESKLRKNGIRRRVFECECGYQWNVYQSTVNPITAIEEINDLDVRRTFLS